MKPSTAETLTDMMVSAVSSGTGTAGQISGVEVAQDRPAETGVAEGTRRGSSPLLLRRTLALRLQSSSRTRQGRAARRRRLVREIMTSALSGKGAPNL